jgi:hypothetical protein
VLGQDQTPDDTAFPRYESGPVGKAADFALAGGNSCVVSPISSHLSFFLSALRRGGLLLLPPAACSGM